MSLWASLLDQALDRRKHQLFQATQHKGALRLFNGFTEGHPGLTIDLYGRTALLMLFQDMPEFHQETMLRTVREHLLPRLPWLHCVLLKRRMAATQQERNGVVLWGDKPDRKILEHGVWYALELTMHQDASFYLDTRNLRLWAQKNLQGKSVLNTFAYTGSLGIAAKSGGAEPVTHLDLSRNFLNVAKASYALNGWPIERKNFKAADFFTETRQFRKNNIEFDAVFLDPPFFSSTSKGQVDLVTEYQNILNKARPLVKHNGWLIAVNNALFVAGSEYIKILEGLTHDGYLSVETLIDVPKDCLGSEEAHWPADPAPFNHPTKIAILRVQRKDGS